MLSRVADNLYWMSRYLERAEHCARIAGVHLNLMLEHEPASQDRRWWRVLAALGSTDPVEGDAFATAQIYARDQIVTSIAAARENARQVREQISSEMWPVESALGPRREGDQGGCGQREGGRQTRLRLDSGQVSSVTYREIQHNAARESGSWRSAPRRAPRYTGARR